MHPVHVRLSMSDRATVLGQLPPVTRYEYSTNYCMTTVTSTHRQTIMEASEAVAPGPAALRGPWRGKQGVDFNDIIDIFAKSKALKAVF